MLQITISIIICCQKTLRGIKLLRVRIFTASLAALDNYFWVKVCILRKELHPLRYLNPLFNEVALFKKGEELLIITRCIL